MVYLICGLPGSGKTTFAKRLTVKKRAVRFTLDEWVISLYGTDHPAQNYPTYEKRCIELIASISEQLLRSELDIILDFGFFKKRGRDRFRKLAKKYKTTAKVYYLNTNEKIIRKRIDSRNKHRKKHKHVISRSLLKIFMSDFEEPTQEEATYVKANTKV
jgi:predicted kinase